MMDLKAGGSVGHTAGVINALAETEEVHVITNDVLPEVKIPVELHKPWLRRGLPEAIKELLCNVQFLLYAGKQASEADVIYYRPAGMAFTGAYLANRHAKPLVLEFNGSEAWILRNWRIDQKGLGGILRYIYRNFIALPLMDWFEDYNIRMSALIVVVSEALRESLVQSGVSESKILVNPNGVDSEKFYNGCGKGRVRQAYGLQDKVVLGFIGTFGQWHGVEEMAYAIVEFANKYPEQLADLKFLLIGDGVLMPKVKEIIREGNVEHLVIFTGIIPQEEAPVYLDACDIFLSPHKKNPDGSKFFGSPTKLFEYMAMEKGIIASDLEQIGEILEHGKTAYLIEPNNVSALVEGMYYMVTHPKERTNMGMEARACVLENYTWEKHVKRILDAIPNTRR